MRDGNHVTEMEEIARGEEFIQAGVCTLPPLSFRCRKESEVGLYLCIGTGNGSGEDYMG